MLIFFEKIFNYLRGYIEMKKLLSLRFRSNALRLPDLWANHKVRDDRDAQCYNRKVQTLLDFCFLYQPYDGTI